MFPSISFHDIGNGGSGNTIISGNQPVNFTTDGPSSDIPNVVFSKLCEVMTISAIQRSVSHLIEMVVFYCIPSQVVKMIIELVAVIMASLHTIRSVSNKGTQNEGMNKFKFVSERTVNSDPIISTPLVINLFQEVRRFGRPIYCATRGKRAHAPKIANLVSWVIW